jgi:hypothetical protein
MVSRVAYLIKRRRYVFLNYGDEGKLQDFQKHKRAGWRQLVFEGAGIMCVYE